jgi:lipopolysaccharide transport system ATP-binding protein
VTDVVIRAEGLGKSYLIGHEAEREHYTALRDVLARGARSLARSAAGLLRGRQIVAGDRIEQFWALKDVSFEVKRGEVVGIIGRNGAGKSTLLKILSRITEPSAGRVTIKGRVASLLEVGTGFHPELTGRENIYLNGAILGMTRAEIRAKFDAIVAFAEVERFLDTPVKRYSSGMYVRLAFAVAAHLEPEILVVDEVLAVGDAEFQRKCLGKMGEVASGGRTVLFVSHNMAAVRNICSRSLLLRNGQLMRDAPTDDVVDAYVEESAQNMAGRTTKRIHEGFTLERVGLQPNRIASGDPATIEFEFTATRRVRLSDVAILIHSSSNTRVAIIDIRDSGILPLSIKDGTILIRSQIEGLPLVEGDYAIGLYLGSDDFRDNLLELAALTIVSPRSPSNLIPYPPHTRGVVVLQSSNRIEHLEEMPTLQRALR